MMTLPLSGTSSYAVWELRNSATFCRVKETSSPIMSMELSAAELEVSMSVSPSGALRLCSSPLTKFTFEVFDGRFRFSGTCPALWASTALTKIQLFTLPIGSGRHACASSCRHSPSTMNLYWWYPGGKLTTQLYRPGDPSTVCIGTVSTQRVKDPHRNTWFPPYRHKNRVGMSCGVVLCWCRNMARACVCVRVPLPPPYVTKGSHAQGLLAALLSPRPLPPRASPQP
mmetsp:Transcript_24614/g.53021  ORF Transcript_24614/g.53021 Transcript_24614/m.53021 type:complete len:227 (-) Transcript_24614:88-768(-)